MRFAGAPGAPAGTSHRTSGWGTLQDHRSFPKDRYNVCTKKMNQTPDLKKIGRHNLKREETHVSIIIESFVKYQCFVDLKHDEPPVTSWSNHGKIIIFVASIDFNHHFPWLPRPRRDLPEWCHRSGGPWAAMAPGLTASGGNPGSPGGSCGGKSGEIQHFLIDRVNHRKTIGTW